MQSRVILVSEKLNGVYLKIIIIISAHSFLFTNQPYYCHNRTAEGIDNLLNGWCEVMSYGIDTIMVSAQ